jgi:starch synthase
LPPSRNDSKLRVLFATPECAPLVKTGGLGDVSAALPAALRALGIDARVLLPGFPPVLGAAAGAREIGSFSCCGFGVRLLEAELASGVPLIVLDAPPLFSRSGGPYQDANGEDWRDNAVRFGVLSRAIAMLGSDASPIDWRPDVVHCNDWPTALAPVYLRHGRGKRAATLITIHNLAFQGIFPYAELDRLGLPEASRGIEGLEFYGQASFLKGALLCADAINTVSPTYAREIQTEELGFGLGGVLRQRSRDLYGVLNGVDTELWDPRRDPWIASRYGPDTLEAKGANKRAFKERLGLRGADDVPLLATVGRLTHQKGIDVIVEAIPEIAKIPAQLAVIGTGDRALAQSLHAARAHHPESVSFFIGFDEGFAHLLEAGADMFLMPSRFEPCGMNQMYSQRYGTPPIAHATGGLVDTITDGATGFLMRELNARSLVKTVQRAISAYRDAKAWTAMQRNGMARDFGWGPAAKAYAEIYSRIRSTS